MSMIFGSDAPSLTSEMTPPYSTAQVTDFPVESSSTTWPVKRTDASAGSRALCVMIVDRSGSMTSMGSEVTGGVNAFLDKQRTTDQEDNSSTHVILSTFDDRYEMVRSGDLKTERSVGEDEVAPRDMTALYDGIGYGLDDAIKVFNSAKIAFGKVIIFILTDGEENSSKRWTKDAINARIKQLQSDHDWIFFFAAANQDAMKAGGDLGILEAQSITFSPGAEGCAAAFESAAAQSSSARRGGARGFTQEQRKTAL